MRLHYALPAIFLLSMLGLESAAAQVTAFDEFSVTVSTSGGFTATVEPDATDSSCTIEVRGSHKSSQVETGTVISSFPAFSPIVTLQRTVAKKIKAKKKNGKKNKKKLFFAAYADCDDDDVFEVSSETVQVKVKVKNTNSKVKNAKKWLQELDEAFES